MAAAAKQLGCPQGTLNTRLVRGRAMLGKRLLRHGLVVSGTVLATALCQNAASACVPGPLVVSTVKAATLMAAGKTLATGAISAKVVALTEGVLKAMLMTKIKVAIAVVLAVHLIGAGVGLVYCQTAGSGPPGRGQPVTVQKQQPTPKADGKDDEEVAHTDDPAVKQGNPNNAQPGDQANKANQVQELPAELVAAWKKAGARVGWMSADQLVLKFREGAEGKKGEVPAFRFPRWTAGVVAKLPQPQTAFGLDVQPDAGNGRGPEGAGRIEELCNRWTSGTQVTDAGLKELAGLKSLQSLDLRQHEGNGRGPEGTGRTEEPAIAEPLAARKVTDAGLKELAGLKSLQIAETSAATTRR